MQKNKIKKTVIFSNYECNNNCIFCVDADKRLLPARTFEEMKKEISGAKKSGSDYLEIIGGEFTIRKDAVEIIKFAKKLKFKNISITTNGRLFSYFDYVEKFVNAGITDIVFSIHGHNEKLHDSLTMAQGSFQQIIESLANLKKLKFKNLGTNTTIVKQNYKHLSEIGKFIFDQGIKNAEFIFVDPTYGGAKNNFEKIVPKISLIAPQIKKCLDIGRINSQPHWHIRYVPLCIFEKYLDQISELDEVKKFQTEHIAEDFVNRDVEGSRRMIARVKGPQCKQCRLNNICEGIWKEYAKHYGFNELTPLK